jgi:chromosome partitioning protein
LAELPTQSPDVTPPSTPTPSARPRVVALINQKGGVGKTTTTVNLGAALARQGKRVLMIDLDPQAHLTLHMGIDPATLDSTVYDLMTDDDVEVAAILQHAAENIDVLPAEVNLAGVEAELAPKMVTGQAQALLARRCASVVDQYDFVLLDCPPSLGLLTINGLTMAREVVVPMQSHFLALQGLSKLLETIGFIRQSFNPQLVVSGVILCMHEGHTILASEVVADLKAFLDANRNLDVPWRDAVVFEPAVRRNIKLAECPSFGKSIFDYAADCAGAHDYAALAAALVAQNISP